MTPPTTAAAPARRSHHDVVDRRALHAAIAAAPIASIASAATYAATSALSSFDGPLLPDVLAALFAGLAVTLVCSLVVATIARRSTDAVRNERAMAIVVWCGSIGASIGAALPIALWALVTP